MQPSAVDAIMSPPRHRMEATSLDNGQESHNHPERDEEHDETSRGIYDSSPISTMAQALKFRSGCWMLSMTICSVEMSSAGGDTVNLGRLMRS